MEATPHAGDNQFIGAPKNDSPAPDANVKSWSPLVYVRLYLAEGFYGYLGKSGSQNMWACVVQHKNDAVIIDQVLGKRDACYFWIKDFGYMTWSGGLSGNPVAFNSWAYANMWKHDSGHLIAADSGAPLSSYDDATKWVYANAGYRPFRADFELAN